MEPIDDNKSPNSEATCAQKLLHHVITACEKDRINLSTERLLALSLTSGKENPLALALTKAITWTKSVKRLCEDYHVNESHNIGEFVKTAEELQDGFCKKYDYGRWVELSLATLEETPAGGEFAKAIDWRRHQIIVCVHGFISR